MCRHDPVRNWLCGCRFQRTLLRIGGPQQHGQQAACRPSHRVQPPQPPRTARLWLRTQSDVTRPVYNYTNAAASSEGLQARVRRGSTARAQCPTHRLLRASTAHSSHSTKRPKRELLRFGHFKSRTFDAHSRRSNNYLKQSVEANGLTPEERIEARRLYDVIHGTWHLLACMTVTGLAVGLIEAYSFDLDAWSEESYVRFKPRVGVGIRCTHAPCCFPSRASPHSRPPPPLACARERVASCTGAQVWREVS